MFVVKSANKTTCEFLLSGVQVQATSNSQKKYCVTAQHCWKSSNILMLQKLACHGIIQKITLRWVDHQNANLLSQEVQITPGKSEIYLLLDVVDYSTKMHYNLLFNN